MADNQNDIGGKVGLDITDFKANIAELNRQIKVIDTGFKAAAAGMEDWGKSEEGLNTRNKALTDIIDLQRQKVQNLTDEYKKVSAESGESGKAAQNLQVKINRATEELNKNESELRRNSTALEDLGQKSESTADDLKKAGDAAEESGNKAEKGESGWSKLGGGLAKAGEVAAKAAAAVGTATVGIGSSLVAASVSGASYADDILTTATQTGIASDKLQEYKYAAELVDVSTETLTKSMAKNIKSMDSAREGTGAAAEAYKKLGISVTDSQGNLKDGETVYWQAIDALGNVQNETERDALAMQLFGKSAQELNPLIEVGSQKMQELGDKARDAGYVLGDEALGAFGDFDDQLQLLKVGSEGAKNALGTVLLPVLTNLAGNGVDLLGEFTRGVAGANGDLGKVADVIAEIIPKIIDTIMTLLPQLIDAGMKILGAIGQGILDNLPTLINATVNIMMTLLNGLIGALPQLSAGAVQLITTLSQGLIDNLPEIINGAVEIVLALVQGITESLPQLIPAVVQAILTITQGLIDNLPQIIEAALQLILALAQGLINALPELLKKAPEIITALVNGLINSIPLLVDAAIQLILGMIDFLTDPENLGMLIKASIEIVLAIVSGLIQAIPKLIEGVMKLISSIADKFSEINWAEVGANIISGIVNGIKNGVKSIGDAAKGAAKSALDSAKNFLGIHSPSTVMRDQVGLQVGAGVAKGIEESKKQVKAAMSGLNDEIIENPVPEVSGISGKAGKGNWRDGDIYITVPLTMDGQTVTRKTSRIQYRNNKTFSRTKGVVPT